MNHSIPARTSDLVLIYKKNKTKKKPSSTLGFFVTADHVGKMNKGEI